MGRSGKKEAVLDAKFFPARHLLILKEMTKGLELGKEVVGGWADGKGELDLGAVTDTLASILNRTTSLIPNALFPSLGIPRLDENLGDAKHGIDHGQKQSCEDTIFLISESIYTPLRKWVDRIRTRDTTPTGPTQNHAVIAASNLQEEFYLSCQRDLRANAARMRLYLEDDRTMSVLLGHAMDRTVDGYADFKEVVWGCMEVI